MARAEAPSIDGGRTGTAQVLVAALSRQPANQAAGKPSTTPPHARSQPAEASMRPLWAASANWLHDLTAQHLSLATPAGARWNLVQCDMGRAYRLAATLAPLMRSMDLSRP